MSDKQQEEQQMEATEQAEEQVGFPDFSAVLAGATAGERPTETRTFKMKGKSYKIEIYVDGRDDAEIWSGLLTAMMHGYTLQAASRAVGKEYAGEEISIPLGVGGSGGMKQITVKDPSYLGQVKVLSLVLKNPGWGWMECLMMGNLLGKGFIEVCEWACKANGITEHFNEQMRELSKNAPNLSR